MEVKSELIPVVAVTIFCFLLIRSEAHTIITKCSINIVSNLEEDIDHTYNTSNPVSWNRAFESEAHDYHRTVLQYIFQSREKTTPTTQVIHIYVLCAGIELTEELA